MKDTYPHITIRCETTDERDEWHKAAARRDTTLSALIKDYLRGLVEKDERKAAKS